MAGATDSKVGLASSHLVRVAQPGTDPRQIDDESSSIASFEDVGGPRELPGKKRSAGKDMVLRAADGEADEMEVPDVLYVVQYRDINGRLLSCKFSPYPPSAGPGRADAARS